MAKNDVTISVEEYKALLMKEMPTDKDKILIDCIIDTIKQYSKLVEFDSYASDFKGIEFNHETQCLKEIMASIYAIDRNKFIEMYKELARSKKEDTIKAMNVEYMRQVKELKNEGK